MIINTSLFQHLVALSRETMYVVVVYVVVTEFRTQN